MSLKKLLIVAGALALAGCSAAYSPTAPCVNEQAEEDTWVCGERPSAVVIEESL